jgi:hypothetical protein
MYKLIIIIIIFLLGLYFVYNYRTYESFETMYRCPNVLFQRGTEFFLHNSKLADIPGVNPLQFKNLEEYVEFTEWQRRQGIKCPILYVQEAYDTQGNTVYKARPSPTDMHAGIPDLILNNGNVNMMPGSMDNTLMDMPTPLQPLMPTADNESLLLDATQDDRPYNINSYPGFDGNNQYIGLETPLDKMYNEDKDSVSPNPMDTNWGGNKYTESLIDAGYYKNNEVSLYVG